jgi:CRP/FNR family nitrogen fixation transcriptional regulator
MGASIRYSRNEEIYGEGEPAGYIHKVVSGAVRSCKVFSDGRRQINGFYLAGDFFGLEIGDEHSSSAESINDSEVLAVKRRALASLSARDTEAANLLIMLSGKELNRLRGHTQMLVKSAHERLASFLLEMADRLSGDSLLELPMSRQDIADYLGLTIETVSRTLVSLEASAAIEILAGRRVTLLDHSALRRMTA